MNDAEERLADLVNEPPVVLMDCTAPQIGIVAAIVTPLGIVMGIVAAIVIGKFTVGLALGFILALVLGWAGLFFIQTKRGQHYGSWLNEQFFLKKIALSEFTGMGSSSLINESKRYGRGARR